jgi:translocation and assembly module TamA
LAQILRLSLFFIFCSYGFADDTLHALTYDFTVLGLDNKSVEKKFDAISSLKTFKESPIFSIQNLNKRISDDYDLLLQLMDAKGYYDCELDVTRNEKNNHTDIIFNLKGGTRYKLKTITIDLGAAHDDVLEVYPFLFEDLPIQVGKHVSAEKIHDTFGIITEKFSNCGYPFAKIKDHSAELVRNKRRMILKIDVDPGPKVRFGEVIVKDNSDVPAAYVQNRTPWEQGDFFDHRKIERYREKLSRTRLFDSIVIDYPKEAVAGEEVPMTVTLTERKSRTISAGLSYSLNEKFAGTVAWTHRNLTSNADRLRTAITAGQVKSKFELDYEVPDFLWTKKTLAPSVAIVHEDTESYVSQSYGAAVLLRTEFAENSEYFYGLSADHDRAKQEGITKKSSLLGIPVGVKYDRRDDLFDPTKGYVLNASFAPRAGKIADAHFITKTILSGSIYHTVASKFVVASWARFGSIAGISLDDVLANQRFYSGGGGSVRAYGYQLLGPLDPSGDPIGGKSLVEGGLELRIRILEDWGAAAFIEAGNVSDHTAPNFKNQVLGGAGLGIRYFTDFGPIRADVAMPFKRRKKQSGGYVDNAVQFYISIGQGF